MLLTYTLNGLKQIRIINYASKMSLIPSKNDTNVHHYEASRFSLVAGIKLFSHIFSRGKTTTAAA
jgi:hypothetical protein